MVGSPEIFRDFNLKEMRKTDCGKWTSPRKSFLFYLVIAHDKALKFCFDKLKETYSENWWYRECFGGEITREYTCDFFRTNEMERTIIIALLCQAYSVYYPTESKLLRKYQTLFSSRKHVTNTLLQFYIVGIWWSHIFSYCLGENSQNIAHFLISVIRQFTNAIRQSAWNETFH